MADTVRTRKDVWKLPAWDPILLWYARAIAAMQARRLDDPTGWRYQAAIHDYDRQADPIADPTDTLPTAADQQRFWIQCQHNSWFFLPWHRMYLACFEQIVAATIVGLGGPANWALPYWNYSDTGNPDARRLPPAFQADKLPDGTANPLRVDARNPGCNTGQIIADDIDTALDCLKEPSFVAAVPAGGDPGFGGPKTNFNHSGGVVGSLETTPHGSMHVAVGGLMGRFNTAGLDPIFWLHHSNIDRLWVVWRQRDPQHPDPTDPQWLTTPTFDFHDATGNVISFTANQVVDTTASPLLYQYEDVSDPLGVAFEAFAEGVRRPVMAEKRIPEMVGATEAPVVLAGRPTSTLLAVRAPTGPALEAAAVGAAPPRTFLNFENITGASEPTSYAVYVNLPEGADPEQHRDRLVGVLPMFGVAEASRSDKGHSGSGLHYALEAGEVIRRLEAAGDWDPANLQVTFVPRRRSAAAADVLEAATEPLRVGQVSLYYS
jgi:tyrosinase